MCVWEMITNFRWHCFTIFRKANKSRYRDLLFFKKQLWGAYVFGGCPLERRLSKPQALWVWVCDFDL